MHRLKLFLMTLGAIFLLGFIALVLLINFVNPNRFKPLIVKQLTQYSGRTINIPGDLSWSFYPTLGIKVGPMEINNPANFKQKTFAAIQNANVSVKVWPLLKGKIESDGIVLKGLTLNLIQKADGHTNWEDLMTHAPTKKEETSSAKNTSAKKVLLLAITGIDVSDATIQWINEKTHQQFLFDQVNLTAKNISLADSFPLTARFHFQTSDLSGSIDFKSMFHADLEKQFFQWQHVQLSADLKKKTNDYRIKTKGDLSLDLPNQRLVLSPWQGELGELQWQGQLTLNQLLSTPRADGHLQFAPFALEDVLKSLSPNEVALFGKKVRGELDIHFNAATKPLLSALSLQGNFKADELRTEKITATHFVTDVQFKNGLLALSSMAADFYQGVFKGNATMNFTSALPKFTLQAALEKVAAGQILNELNPNQKFTVEGLGYVSLNLQTEGSDRDTLVRHLNGQSEVRFADGVLKGVDLDYWINQAHDFIKNESPTVKNTHQTPFGRLTATASFQEGVMTNQDLLIEGPLFETRGKGEVNLLTQQMDYALATQIKKEDQAVNWQNLYGLTIPITLTHTLNDPAIHLDLASLLKQLAERKSEKVKEKIEAHIKEKLPEAAQMSNQLLGH